RISCSFGYQLFCIPQASASGLCWTAFPVTQTQITSEKTTFFTFCHPDSRPWCTRPYIWRVSLDTYRRRSFLKHATRFANDNANIDTLPSQRNALHPIFEHFPTGQKSFGTNTF
ncbi:unnamed protein product, partial [Ectocarpus fasciculatus]